MKTVFVRNGLKVGPGAFKDCIKLECLSAGVDNAGENINAAVDIGFGSSAFQNTPDLKEIKLI